MAARMTPHPSPCDSCSCPGNRCYRNASEAGLASPTPAPDAERGGESDETCAVDGAPAEKIPCGGRCHPGCQDPAPALPVGGDAALPHVPEGVVAELRDGVWHVSIDTAWLAARDAENWHVMHEALCQRGKVCSAHKPGHWPTLAALVAAIAREAAERTWDEGYLRGTLDTTSDLEPADNPYRAASLGDGSGT